MFKRLGLMAWAAAIPVFLFGNFSKEESSDWTCPNCGQSNTRPYPRYPCIRCGFPYDNRPG